MTPSGKSPRVSVILNCYNQSEWVAESVESVLSQTFRDFELLIVDNGSTDKTPEILKNYSSDPRVRLFLHQENVAISRRFNEAVEATQGEFISFLYSDDYYLPRKLAHQVALLEQLGPEYGVVYGPSLVKNELTGEQWTANSIRASGHIFKDLCAGLNLGLPNMIAPMTRRSCMAGERFYEDVFAEGEAYFFRIALRTQFHFDPEPLTVARDHLRNAGKAIKVNAEIFETCMKRIAERKDLNPGFQGMIHKLLASKLRDVGWTAIRINEDAAWARRSFRRAVGMRPLEIFHPRLICGLLLSFLPAQVRASANKMGNKVRGVRENAVAVAGYK
jgi:glycosyltransferase involved in cell wall biosynthesis